ncbi:hypothetical protein EHQ05_19175 [Leptospira yasudae]|uniref:LIC11612 family fibronectin-binding protein n=1 Tax=Leptospira yasudae TaxID=2202201 RepID=UPI0010846D4B|nr:hypothetical protein [Leptospira yasudae]TGK23551.1 hypothetical protein EHQ05_19175 [Leptospira yasudae]TGM09134.1 hypothetical protein EHQ86_00380 [Leptospira yasudae]
MFRTNLKKAFLLVSIFCIFYDRNVFSETGGLQDRPVSVVLVCEPSAKADKPRYYKSTSLFFKRLKNKRLQENGTAFFVGYGSFASETPAEQLNLAGQNGYDLYIFPQTALENLPASPSGDAVPWISFVVEKKETAIQPTSQKKSVKKGISPKGKKQKPKSKRKLNPKKPSDKISESLPYEMETQEGVGQTSGTDADKIELKKTTSEKKTVKSKKSKTRNTSKTKSGKKRESTEPTKPDSSKETSSQNTQRAPTSSKTIVTSIGNASFELSFESLKFWFSTTVNPTELSWSPERILFLAGEKTADEWNQILSGKPDDTTAIRLLNSAQDLRFNEGIYYTGCASPQIPNGISVLNFFFRGNRLIRLKQESFSLNSDGSGKSWELE